MIHRLGRILRAGMSPAEITVAIRTTVLFVLALGAIIALALWL